MGYNEKDYIKIRKEFESKYLRARQVADERRVEIHALIPDVFEIDRVLSHTGLDIMAVISAGGDTNSAIAKLEARNNELLTKREQLLVSRGFPADYTDVHYDCERCGDTGFVDNRMCDCMKRALVLAGYESSGLGRLIDKQSFSNFSLNYYSEGNERKCVEACVNILSEFASTFDGNSGKNFLLFGGTGLGKTHLSTSVAKLVIERGFDVLYVSAIGMIGDFEKNRFGTGNPSETSNDISRYYSADLLIIDDLGTEVVNKFTQSCVYEIINTRINSGKSTIINTNLSIDEIKSGYTDRIYSRLLGEYQPMRFTGTDIRTQRSVEE